MKNFIIVLIGLAIVFGALIFFSAPSLTIYIDSANYSDNYNKYCGYLFNCRYYDSKKSGTLELDIHQPEDTDDRDYYYTYNGIRCNTKLDIKSITARFVNSNDTIHFQKKQLGRDFLLDATIQYEIINLNEQIELRIAFSTGEQDKLIALKRHNDRWNKDTEILLALGIAIAVLYILWGLISFGIFKIFPQYSLTTYRIAVGLLIAIVFYFIITKIIFVC